jgi:hypothetical protein
MFNLFLIKNLITFGITHHVFATCFCSTLFLAKTSRQNGSDELNKTSPINITLLDACLNTWIRNAISKGIGFAGHLASLGMRA